MKASNKTYIKAVFNLLTTLVILLLIIFLLPKVVMFFFPFVLGWIISLIAKPLVKLFEEKVRLKRKAGSAIVIILVLAAVIAIAYGICYFLFNQIVGFVNDFPTIWSSIVTEFDNAGKSLTGIYEKLPTALKESLDTFISNSNQYFRNFTIDSDKLESVGNFVNRIPDIIMGIVMTLLSSYFFVADKDYLSNLADKYLPASVIYYGDLIKKSISKAFGGYFKAQFKIELWVYIITVIGLFIIKIDYAILVALGICFMDFLPVFGAGTVMVPWAIFKFIDGNYKIGIALLIIWGIGQLVRQIIQPKIVGDSVGMDSIPTLFLLFIGFALKGVLGMILAIPVGIIIKNLIDEGVFDTSYKSLRILVSGFNSFRRLDEQDENTLKECEEALANSYKTNKD